MGFASIGSDTDGRRWGALAVIVAAQFMVILDIAIVNVALPSIKSDLHFSQESLQWVITAYAILFGGVLLLESRVDQAHRHFDLAGAASVTAGLMLLVYAMTRATQHGWANATTVALLAASALTLVAFVAIELRSRSPLLPMRIFQLRTL